ncbi:MAG: hypothetical protein FJ404_01685 [Verrucomicrobia bacterium]|nr:hypothetical protein [Verrucomicrobiota bacterium]
MDASSPTLERPITIGLRRDARIDSVEIVWRGGRNQAVLDPQSNTLLRVRESRSGRCVLSRSV